MPTDNVTGIVLDIPANVLSNIKRANDAILTLEQTSRHAAKTIEGNFGTQMPRGVEKFIQAVEKAQGKLGNLKMPTIDASGLSRAVQALSQAMGTIDKSATTGSNRLTRIANAMTALQTANPNPQLFQNIADGIAKIGNTSQQTIQNVSQLAQTMAQLARDIRTVQQAQQAESSKTATAAQYNKLFKEQADLVRRINEIKAKGADADVRDLTLLDRMRARYDEIHQLLDKLNRKKQTAASELARTQGYNRVGDAQARTDASGAINYAQQAKSLKDLQAAYNNLKAVMATTNPDSSAWRQMNEVLGQTRNRIDEIKKKMGEFKSSYRGVGDIAGQLSRSMAAVFSVSAITGYINKMIQVRAEFELQNVALRAILQNKDEADKIFMQVQQMALQSPFSILQMTTFTKQLAAYRIESEKLVGTTKMLADVSAGLGVDMGRLILAYGQVKSANYLRAAEVRQFTEAGLNIAGELATYFSELQGKMVSVGDVMEMITKRMVRFEDVEEVFKRVTSAGGLFYDMQKKQSETLRGQLQRIKDAMSIMFNEIGKSNQGTISWVLTAIRSLINNWRILAVVIKDAARAMGAFYAAKGIAALVAYLPTLITNVKSFISFIRLATTSWATFGAAAKSVMASLSATGWGAIIAGVALLATTIYQAVTATSALNEELDRIELESASDMYDLIGRYRELADTVRDVTKPYQERKDAMDELHRTYDEILPAEMLEIDNISKMAKGYKEAEEAIRNYSAAKQEAKMREAISTEYADDFKDEMADFADAFYVERWNIPELLNIPEKEIKGTVARIFTDVQEQVTKGIIPKEEARSEIQKRLASFYNIDNNPYFESLFTGKSNATASLALNRFMGIFDEIEDEYGELEARSGKYATQAERELKPVIKEYEELQKAVKDYTLALEARRELEKQGGYKDESGNVTPLGKSADVDLEKALNALNKWRGDLHLAKIETDDVNTALKSAADSQEHLADVSDATLTTWLNKLKKTGEETKNNTLVNWVENGLGALAKLNLSPAQKQLQNVINETERLNGVDFGDFKWALISSSATVSDVAANVKKEADSIQEKILQYQQATANGLAPWIAALWFLQGKSLEEVTKQFEALTSLSKKLGNVEKKSTPRRSGGGKSTDPWGKRVQLFKELNTEYEKLLKNYSAEEAHQRIISSYEKTVAEVFKGQGKFADISKWLGFDKASMTKMGNEMLDSLKISPEKRKELMKELSGLSAEIDVKIQEDAVEEMNKTMQKVADNFELSETFRNLGVPINVVYTLGGKPTTLAQYRQTLEDTYKDTFKLQKKYGTDGEKAYDQLMKKISDKEQQNAVKRAKNYVKYLTESLSERAQIEVKALRDVEKIKQDETLDTFSKEQAINQRRKKMNEDLAKFDFDEFKASDVYVSVFQDLERASKTQLQYVIDKLRELQSTYKDLSPAQIKSIAKALNDAEKAMANKGMFFNIKKVYEYAKESNELKKQQVATQAKIYEYTIKEAEQGQLVADAELKLRGIKDQTSAEYKEQETYLLKQRAELLVIQNVLKTLKSSMAKITEEINKGEEDSGRLEKTWQETAKTLEAISSALSDIQEGLENMGLGSESLADGFSSAQEVISAAVSTGNGAVQAFTDPSPWGKVQGAIQAVGGAIKLVGSFFAIGDKKKERQIKRLQERVEALQKSYEKLGDAIKDAYAFDDYNLAFNDSMQNLEAQRDAINEQIALEESKKKSDKDKLKEYADALDELAEKEKQLREERYSAMGSYSDNELFSAAEDFVKAWIDAYKETGNGLDALNGKWDDFYENLLVKQATSAVVSKRMAKYVKRINDIIDAEMNEAESRDAMREVYEDMQKEMGKINTDLKGWFSTSGLNWSGQNILSDLQKGIQNITEPQAAAIEAYLNSMRFAVFEQNNILDQLLSSIQAQYGSTTESPILNEVKQIRSILASIDRRLGGVIESKVGRGDIVKVG